MRTAKESFLMTGKADEFKRLVASDAFEPACNHALLQLQAEMLPNTTPGLPTDPYVAIDANGQMHGAARVLEILKTLAEPIEKPVTTKRESLHY